MLAAPVAPVAPVMLKPCAPVAPVAPDGPVGPGTIEAAPVAPVAPVAPAGIAFTAASIASKSSAVTVFEKNQPANTTFGVVPPWPRNMLVTESPAIPSTRTSSALPIVCRMFGVWKSSA